MDEKKFFITKTVILSFFVLFSGILYVVLVKIEDYDISDLLETYALENKKIYKIENNILDYNNNSISTNDNVNIEVSVLDENEVNDNLDEESIIVDSSLININTADVSLLDTLPKIGPTIAKAIITYRDKYGKFKTIDQIKNVNGIGDKIFDAIKDLICV